MKRNTQVLPEEERETQVKKIKRVKQQQQKKEVHPSPRGQNCT